MAERKVKQEDTNYKKRFINGLNKLSYSKSLYEVWQDAMLLMATSISNAAITPLKETEQFEQIWEERESEYLKTINKYSKKEQKLFPQMFALLVKELEIRPWQDLLGELYMTSGISSKNKGQFFTPYSVCKIMSELSMPKKEIAKTVHEKGYVTINDSACGAGATLVASMERCSDMFKRLNWQNHVCYVAQDIDFVSCYMCYIQLSLHGAAGYVCCGNTLTEPDVTDLRRIWFTPMWFEQMWAMRRLFHGQDILGREIRTCQKS